MLAHAENRLLPAACEQENIDDLRNFRNPASQLDELLGTKLRAPYQRKKRRDLFDLFIASRNATTHSEPVVECFASYIERYGLRISRADFERNLHEKLKDKTFLSDIEPLISLNNVWSFEDAA